MPQNFEPIASYANLIQVVTEVFYLNGLNGTVHISVVQQLDQHCYSNFVDDIDTISLVKQASEKAKLKMKVAFINWNLSSNN